MRLIAAFLLTVSATQTCWGWSEPGHHIVAVLAYDLLNKNDQQKLQALLKAHPRLKEDFATTEQPKTPLQHEHWLIGRAGYWPDVARSQPEYHRSTWHYQLGAALVIGEVKDVPQNPGPAPQDATLETQELYIAQAIEVCRKALHDKRRSNADRAVALCWILHLVGDAHQPCHAGSLYAAGVFPEGDRGANSIPTKQSRNLHALWDGLFGNNPDAGDIRRRCETIRSDKLTWSAAAEAAKKPDGLDPLTWLAESSEAGRIYVYTPEVLEPVDAIARGLTSKLEMIDLTEDYLKSAGELARKRAAFAAHRLSTILHTDLR